MDQSDLDSSHHESDLSVQTRIQGHEKSLEANPNDLASRMGLAQAHMQGEVQHRTSHFFGSNTLRPLAATRTLLNQLRSPLRLRTGWPPPSTWIRS